MTKTTKDILFDFNWLDAVGVVFITLKLLGIISWSWWLVTAPFWVPILTLLVILLVVSIKYRNCKPMPKRK